MKYHGTKILQVYTRASIRVNMLRYLPVFSARGPRSKGKPNPIVHWSGEVLRYELDPARGRPIPKTADLIWFPRQARFHRRLQDLVAPQTGSTPVVSPPVTAVGQA